MPPNNRLAPPLRNSLASYVPAPLDPNMMPPEVSPRFGVGDYAQNLSIGVGEGLTSRLKSAKQTLQDPVQAVKETAMAIRQMYDDPMLALQALRQLRQQIMSGPLGAGQAIGEMAPISVRGAPVMQELDVYHGTPHRFEPTPANPLGEFDASKIGTGEGAQAYGHGIYFAESPSVAKAYQNPNAGSMFLGSRGINVSGKTYSSSGQLRNARDEATDMTEKAMYDILATAQSKGIDGPSKIAKAIKDNPVAWGSWEFGQDTLNAAMKRIRKEASFSSQKGSFYKADLPDEMIDRMLDWDKPLSEQPKMVRDAINAIVEAEELYKGKYAPRFLEKDATAGDIVSVLESALGGPKVASSYLRDAGIPGIKYKDAGSRGQPGTGTRNFVVFPGEEKKVRILERK